MNHSMIKAVSFDAAGTLIQLAEEVGTSYSRVAASFGVAVDPPAASASSSKERRSKCRGVLLGGRVAWPAALPYRTVSTDD